MGGRQGGWAQQLPEEHEGPGDGGEDPPHCTEPESPPEATCVDRDSAARKRPSGRSLAWGARPQLCPPLTAGEGTGGSELCCPQDT